MVQRFGTPSLCCWKQQNDIETDDNNTTTRAGIETMNSPLPDSSALEAGIIEDSRPSRLSRVQDNVRDLLRTSVFGSVKSTPTTPTHAPAHGPRTPVVPSPVHFERRAEFLPSPVPNDSAASSATHLSERIAAFPCPPESYRDRVQQMAHQSAMFNTRAVAALNHPDLSDPSLEDLTRLKAQRRQRHGWKRSKRSRRATRRLAGSQGVLCLFASLLLAALVATYVTIATTESDLTTTFHVLFVLGICLATIVFAHSAVRLFLVGRSPQSRPLFVAVSRSSGHGRHHRHRHHDRCSPQVRRMPSLSAGPDAFVPRNPIPVHLSSDDLRLDPNEAQPTAVPATVQPQDWDKEVNSVPNPPPAYGRWRGSVRADPELLHWQAVSSPTSPDTPALPSPTYEEAMAAAAHNGYPPSYVTRESPARQRELQNAQAGLVREHAEEPEMVEVRAVGLAV